MFDVNKLDDMTMEEINELMNHPTEHGLTFGDMLQVVDREIYRLTQENKALRSELDEMRDRIRQILELFEV